MRPNRTFSLLLRTNKGEKRNWLIVFITKKLSIVILIALYLIFRELNNIVNSAESDMNTENSTKSSPSSLSAASSDTHSKRSNGGSYTEEFVVSSFLPRPSTRSEMSNKTRSSNKNHGNKVQLDSDLCGETSDFSIIIPVNNNGSNQADDDLGSITSSLSAGGSSDAGPTEISRKKITRTFFGGGASDMEDDDDMEDRGRSYPDEDEENCRTTPEKKRNKVTRKSVRSAGASTTGGGGLRLRKADSTEHKIQPDILRTIPTRLFHHKSWDVLEARSPMYASDDMEFSGPGRRQTLHLRDQREEMMRMMSSGAGPAGGRRRHASVDNLTSIQQQRTSSSTGRDEMGPIFLHPTVHHPSVHQRDHSMDEMLLRQHEQQQRYLMEMPHQQVNPDLIWFNINYIIISRKQLSRSGFPATFYTRARAAGVPFGRPPSRWRLLFPPAEPAALHQKWKAL